MTWTFGYDVDTWPDGVWSIDTTSGETITGYLPVWADEDPSGRGVALDRLIPKLSDITHEVCFGGQLMRVRHGMQEPGEDTAVFVPYLQCRPFHENGPDASVPRVSIQIVDDVWIPDMGPEELAAFADKLRDLHDLLMGKVVRALITALADWDMRHPRLPPSPRHD